MSIHGSLVSTHQPCVDRPRLIETLHESAQKYTLVLINGVAGSGKTTLLEQWTNYEHILDNSPFSLSWVRLSRSSDRPDIFWDQLNDAFAQLIPTFTQDLEPFLHSSEQVSVKILGAQSARKFRETISSSRLKANHHYAVILDNFQLIQNEETLEGFAHLMEYVPANVHFIVSGRLSNPLPLVRLKIRNQVATLTTSDLKFNNAEVDVFFKLRNDIKLSAKMIDAVQEYFEGWIAGMQAFCLYPEKSTFTSEVIQAFCSNNRNYIEYITTELLKDISDDELNFLVALSYFDSFDVALCNKVFERKDSRTMIDSLLDKSLIEVKAITETTTLRLPRYLRYIARVFFDETEPMSKDELFGKASTHYESRGKITRAVLYSSRTKDYDKTIRLVEENFWDLYKKSRFLTIGNRISALPQNILESNICLMCISIYCSLFFNQTEDAIRSIEKVSNMIEKKKVHCPEQSDELLEGLVHTFKSLAYSQTGDIELCIKSAEKILSLKNANMSLMRCSASMALGNGLARSKSPAQSISILKQAGLSARADRYFDVTALTTYHIAHEYLREGQLSRAHEELERAIAQIKRTGNQKLQHYIGVLQAPLAEIELERNNLAIAGDYFRESKDDLTKLESLEYYCDYSIALSRFKFAEQKYRDSLDVLEDTLILAHNFKNARAIALLEAHIAVFHSKLGYHALAKGWFDNFDPTIEQSDIPRKEVEHLAYCHILISMERYEEALDVLDELIELASSMQHVFVIIQAYLQKSIAYYKRDSIKEAYAAFDKVVNYAKAEMYIRTIIDENNVMPEIITGYSSFKSFSKNSEKQAYLDQLVSASTAEMATPISKHIMKLLSKRELEVYLLIQQGYTNKQIGQQLFISLETVKSHRKSIKRKLEAGTRD